MGEAGFPPGAGSRILEPPCNTAGIGVTAASSRWAGKEQTGGCTGVGGPLPWLQVTPSHPCQTRSPFALQPDRWASGRGPVLQGHLEGSQHARRRVRFSGPHPIFIRGRYQLSATASSRLHCPARSIRLPSLFWLWWWGAKGGAGQRPASLLHAAKRRRRMGAENRPGPPLHPPFVDPACTLGAGQGFGLARVLSAGLCWDGSCAVRLEPPLHAPAARSASGVRADPLLGKAGPGTGSW